MGYVEPKKALMEEDDPQDGYLLYCNVIHADAEKLKYYIAVPVAKKGCPWVFAFDRKTSILFRTIEDVREFVEHNLSYLTKQGGSWDKRLHIEDYRTGLVVDTVYLI